VEALAALARKYLTLLALRRERASGAPLPERAVFKALADEFPGALHELDTLPMADLEARAAAVSEAAAQGRPEPWMEWMIGYHALFRTALAIKARVRRKGALDDARAQAIARDTGADEAFVQAVAQPPAGRLNRVVLARLSATFGEPDQTIKRALFPGSRR
jgi:hypothetical protein